MKEILILELTIGDLYLTSSYNIKTGIYDERYELITKITPSAIILIIDDRYFHTDYSVINSSYSFKSCNDLKEAKCCHSEQAIYVKIAYNDIIGYININALEMAEKQS